MWFKKKFKIKHILLFVLLLCLVIFVSYLYFYPKKKTISDNIIANPSDTEQWQTYTNEEFHYSMKYPPNWTAQENGNLDYCTPNDNSPCGRTVDMTLSPPSHGSIDIDVLYNKKQLPLDQALKERGWDVEKECVLLKINQEDALRCQSWYGTWSFDFGYKEFLYWINRGSGLLLNTDENYLKQLQSIVPEFELPEHIYNSDLASQEDLEKVVDLENKVIEKIVSTFRILKY